MLIVRLCLHGYQAKVFMKKALAFMQLHYIERSRVSSEPDTGPAAV
jgi:hypothetical protein